MESITKNRQTKTDIINMVQKAFGCYITDQSISIKELTEGFFNVAYELVLPDQTVILKIAPPQGAMVMSYEENIMKAEVEALTLVKKNTRVPVPEVLYYDDSHSICDADYFFMEKIEGDSFFQQKNKGLVPFEVQNSIYSQMGCYNYELNQIKGELFGYLGTPKKQGRNWRETFLTLQENVLQDGERIGINLTVPYDKLRTYIHKASYSLDEVTEPSFVHWDLWDGNVFIKENKISGIIDFERAMWADPLMEFNFRSHIKIKDFYEGYGRYLREEAPVRALLYDIYLFSIMVIETKYRGYPDQWQYNFASKQLRQVMEELEKVIN